jgi:hypothetical protein
MNRLDITVRVSHIYEAGGDNRVVDFVIDGLTVADHVRRIDPDLMEYPQPASGQSNPDGPLVGVTEWRALIESDVFLTGRHPEFTGPHEGLLPLLVCSDCGTCWCHAVWTRFRRDGEDNILWDGLGLVDDDQWRPLPGTPAFRFSGEQYRSVFATAHAAALKAQA